MKHKKTKEEITEIIKSVLGEYGKTPGIDTSRLKKQFPTVLKIVNGYLNGNKNIILEAPTGSGKSVIGFIVSDIIGKIYQENSFILTSDKFLQDQYTRDIEIWNKKKYASLKGQGNYLCHINGNSFIERPGKCKKIPIKNLEKKMPCAKECQYVQARNRAIGGQVTVFNYSYFLSTMNFVFERLADNAPFQPRILTIADEAHKFQDIVQKMFSIKLNVLEHITSFQSIPTYFEIANINNLSNKNFKDSVYQLNGEVVGNLERLSFRVTKENFLQLFSTFKESEELIYQELGNIFKYHDQDTDSELYLEIKEIPDLLYDIEKKCDPDEKTRLRKYLESLEPVINFYLKIQENINKLGIINSVFSEVGYDALVIDFNQVFSKKQRNIPERFQNKTGIIDREIEIQCADTRSLVIEKYLKYTHFNLFMSATIGGTEKAIKQYCQQNGIDDPLIIQMETDWDFSRSPIIHVKPGLSMTYKNKKANMPKMLELIETIIDLHPNEKGIIHTGNYSFSKELGTIFNNRIFCYQNPNEKKEIIEEMGRTDSPMIIAGPSLLEGVDMKNDLSRFQLFMKVPYGNIASQLVKKKMELYPGWYDWVTLMNVLQGIGRIVRTPDDWGVTYFLDSSFQWFLKKNGVPYIIKDRIDYREIISEREKQLQSKLDQEMDNLTF